MSYIFLCLSLAVYFVIHFIWTFFFSVERNSESSCIEDSSTNWASQADFILRTLPLSCHIELRYPITISLHLRPLRFLGTLQRPKRHFPPLKSVYCKTACVNKCYVSFCAAFFHCVDPILSWSTSPVIRTCYPLQAFSQASSWICDQSRKDVFFVSPLPDHTQFQAKTWYLHVPKLIPQILLNTDRSTQSCFIIPFTSPIGFRVVEQNGQNQRLTFVFMPISLDCQFVFNSEATPVASFTRLYIADSRG